MERILITGGNGFLGSNLSAAFLKASNRVLVISRSSTAIKHLAVEFIAHTSPGYNQFVNQITGFAPTIVIHCAWDGGNNYNDVNSSHQITNISYGTELLDILTSLTQRPKFIGIGSFSEYGNLTTRASETLVDSPVTLYGQAKSCFKNLSKMICEQSGLSWIWVRPCYIYGPGDVTTRFIPSMIRKLSINEPIVLDSCTTTIDYLYVDDFCNAVISIINSQSIGVFNVCSGKEYSIKTIIEQIYQLTKSSSTITFDKSRDRLGLSNYICGSSDKIRALGWSPMFEIEDGLRSTYMLRAVNTECCFLSDF